jgi:hypothetical protein
MIFFKFITDDTLLSNKADLRKKVKYNAKEPNESLDRCMYATTQLSSVSISEKVILKSF